MTLLAILQYSLHLEEPEGVCSNQPDEMHRGEDYRRCDSPTLRIDLLCLDKHMPYCQGSSRVCCVTIAPEA